MSHNFIREIKNKANSIAQVERKTAALFENDTEVKQFGFDAFSLWGMNAPAMPQAIADFFNKHFKPEDEHFLSGTALMLDDWNRGMIEMNKAQAVELARLVEDWNWTEPEDYNPYTSALFPATGDEHTIDVNPGTYKATTSWQWS